MMNSETVWCIHRNIPALTLTKNQCFILSLQIQHTTVADIYVRRYNSDICTEMEGESNRSGNNQSGWAVLPSLHSELLCRAPCWVPLTSAAVSCSPLPSHCWHVSCPQWVPLCCSLRTMNPQRACSSFCACSTKLTA